MGCPDLEDLLREGPDGHAARCQECAALLEAWADVDAGLEAAWRGVHAPPSLAAAVRLRIDAERSCRAPSLLPEVLDLIGWLAILTIVAVVVPRFVPLLGAVWAGVR
jgi:hypothetical protein